MASFPKYPKADFSSSQNFLARDPSSSGQVIRVQGQSIIDAAVADLVNAGSLVQSIDTLTAAIATDYASGTYVLTGGGTLLFDGDQAIYRVSDPGSGGTVMNNGNELVLFFVANTPENLVTPVDSVADLFGLMGSVDGQQISVNGYQVGSIVGGGQFSWGSGIHNGVTRIDPTRAFPDYNVPAEVTAWFLNTGLTVPVWERIVSDGLSFFDSGGIGTGIGDDTSSVQALFNVATTIQNTSGTFVVTTSTISSSIDINCTNTTLIQKFSTAGNIPIIDFVADDATLKINGLIFDGNRINQLSTAGNACVRFGNFSNRNSGSELSVIGCAFKNVSGFGVLAYGDKDNATKERLHIERNRFESINEGDITSYNPAHIFVADGFEVVTVISNFFDQGRTPTTYGANACHVTSTDPSTRHTVKLRFENNDIYRLGRFAANGLGALDVYVWGESVTISGNKVYTPWAPGLRIKASSEYISITDNQVFDVQNSYEAISLANTTTAFAYKDVIVSDNIVDGCAVGIFIEGSTSDLLSNVNCHSNIIENCTTDGINANNVDNLMVDDNIISSVGRYGVYVKTWAGKGRIAGNIIENTSNKAIYATWLNVSSGENLDISHNQIDSAIDQAIHVIRAVSLTMIGNEYSGSAITDFIKIEQVSDSAVIIGNNDKGLATNKIVRISTAEEILILSGNAWEPRLRYSFSAPASGTWSAGDITYDTTPSAAGFVGWVCVTAGTPGTWKTWGAISV